MSYEESTYRFGPLERGGIILGLRMSQVVGFIVAGVLAVGVLQLIGGGLGLLMAMLIIAAAAFVLVLPFRGRSLEEWVPVMVRFLSGRWSKRARYETQLAQVAHVINVPDGGLEPELAAEPRSMPSELATIELLEAGLTGAGDARVGVIKDRKAKTFTAVLRCQGQAFALMAAEEREQRLADYGGVLAAMARDDSPVRRIQWIERTVPAAGDEAADYLLDAKRLEDSINDPSQELTSYLQLLGASSDVPEDHELLQIDALRPSARRAIKRLGGGDVGAMAVLGTELMQLREQLGEAGIIVRGVLTRRGVAAAIRNAYDPWGRQGRQRSSHELLGGEGIAGSTVGPMARAETWAHIESDGAAHTTLWVAEWPRIDVRALFLQPLLMGTQTARTVSMVMELVGPSKGLRRVERAATDAAAEASLRGRVGQRTSQRQAQKEEATMRRESELAQGHAEVRFAAFVTVSSQRTLEMVDELEASVSRVELESKRAPLRLERMWGQQAEAFTFTLPLCRGLR